MGWRMRPLAPVADREWVEQLWAAALPPAWPLLPAGIARLRDGLVAEVGADPVGLAAVDMAGSIPLILVHPAHQRRGIGTRACHIGWTTRESFYRQAGYRPWRRTRCSPSPSSGGAPPRAQRGPGYRGPGQRTGT